MVIYAGTKDQFHDDTDNHRIAGKLKTAIAEKMHRVTPDNEFSSWVHSLAEMSNVLHSSTLPDDTGIAIEYNIPLSSNRVDMMLSGYDGDGVATLVVIELKQWQKIEPVEGSDGVVETFVAGAKRQVAHPSYQAWSYAAMISSYNEVVQNVPVEIMPCAYLHNYVRKEVDDPLFSSQYRPYLKQAPAYTWNDVEDLRSYIQSHISKGDRARLIYLVDGGRIKPAKSLQDSIARLVKGNNEFVLLDTQKVAYDLILRESRAAQKDARKHVVVVKGGPGTGKSVLAIQLLARLTQKPDEQFVQYVSKNSAPRNVFKLRLKGVKKASEIDLMFKGVDGFFDTGRDVLSTVLVDEAHRLREKSGMFGNLGENQIKEIIAAAKCSVFFVDDMQRVTIKDCGTVEEIKKHAKSENAVISEIELLSQFRCNGSDGYLGWIENTLGIRETANRTLAGVDYDFRVFDDPSEMLSAIICRNSIANKSRVVAGYCWNWNSDSKNNPAMHDIVIGDFEMSWNLGNTSTWAVDPESVHQAGCIHTCQGLEFEYVGVIIGPDLVYRDGEVVANASARARTDQSVKGLKSLCKKSPKEGLRVGREIVLNTYRTLMSRGMKGCYVYCCDRALGEFLKKAMGEDRSKDVRVIGHAELFRTEVFREVAEKEKYLHYLPLYTFRAACGKFCNDEAVETDGWVKISGRMTPNRNLFVVRASGHSMEPEIKDGELVVFEYTKGACADRDIVLAEHIGVEGDLPEGAFSIKKYRVLGSDVELKPINKEYSSIKLYDEGEQVREYTIVGVLKKNIKVLGVG